MPTRPHVAVVIPAFNPGRFIDEAVASVAAQDVDFELVIVDDGGVEDLGRLAEGPGRLIRQENHGVAAARNRGASETTAPLLAFLDQDDVWLPGKLDAQIAELAENPESPACSTDFEMIDQDGAVTGPGFDQHFFTYDDLLHGCGIALSTVLIRRENLEAVGGFDERYRYTSDWDLWIKLSERFGRLARVERVLTQYRLHSGNESRNYRGILAEGTQILSGHIDGREAGSARAGIERLRWHSGVRAFDAFRDGHTWSALADAVRLAPGYTARSVARKFAWTRTKSS